MLIQIENINEDLKNNISNFIDFNQFNEVIEVAKMDDNFRAACSQNWATFKEDIWSHCLAIMRRKVLLQEGFPRSRLHSIRQSLLLLVSGRERMKAVWPDALSKKVAECLHEWPKSSQRFGKLQ